MDIKKYLSVPYYITRHCNVASVLRLFCSINTFQKLILNKRTYLIFTKKYNNDTAVCLVSESVDDNIASPPKKKIKGTFVHYYNDDYIKYGFICFSFGSNDILKP